MRIFRKRTDYDLIFAADNHLKFAIEQKRIDRAHGRNEAEWKTFMSTLMDIPAGTSQNDHARAILALHIPGEPA